VVFASKPVMEEVNAPVPEPSFVLVVRSMVGLTAVPQTTPLAVTVADPWELMFPPELAVVEREDTAVVVMVGNTIDGDTLTSSFLQEINIAAAENNMINLFFMMFFL